MTNSVTNQALNTQLAKCVIEQFSNAALGELCDLLESTRKSIDAKRAELVGALTNFAHQLHDGAIQPTDDTAPIFLEAQALLSTEATSTVGFDDQVANLLERIDLAASGGFDEVEAGNLPTSIVNDRDRKKETLTHNALHRLQATIETMQRYLESTHELSSIEHLIDRQRDLIDLLKLQSQNSPTADLRAIEDALSVRLRANDVPLSVSGDAALHPDYAELIATFLFQLSDVIGLDQIGDLNIICEQDSIQATIALKNRNLDSKALRQEAIRCNFSKPDAPLSDTDVWQYLLLPESPHTMKNLRDVDPLFDLLHVLRVDVNFKVAHEVMYITTLLPSNGSVEQVTVFRIGADLYAIASDAVERIDLLPKSNDATIQPHGSNYRIKRMDGITHDANMCLFLGDTHQTTPLLVDSIEPDGQLVVFNHPHAFSHLGGSLRLLDGRLVVLISSDDLCANAPRAIGRARKSKLRIMALGNCAWESQLDGSQCSITVSDRELMASTLLQERKPHAVVFRATDRVRFHRFLDKAQLADVPALMLTTESDGFSYDSSYTNFKLVTSVSELEHELHKLANKSASTKLDELSL